MKKVAAIILSSLILVSAGSAQIIPENISVDLNIDLLADNKDSDNGEDAEENNTYGQRINGQSTYTETGPNDPPERRNSQEYGITEDTSEQDKGFLGNLMDSIGRMFS